MQKKNLPAGVYPVCGEHPETAIYSLQPETIIDNL